MEQVVLVEAHPVKFVVIADVMLNPPAGLPNTFRGEKSYLFLFRIKIKILIFFLFFLKSSLQISEDKIYDKRRN
jgi:hypothetical protein